jgi:hypothetical protein
MKTDDLIADLARQVTPVRPLAPPGRRAMVWLVVALALAGAGVVAFGARADVMVRLTQPDYLWTAILALTSSTLAVVATLVLAIPGAERTAMLRRTTVGVLAIWAVTAISSVLETGRGLPITTDPHWPVCFARVALFSFVPVIVLFAMVRRAAPLRLGWTAGLAAAAAASTGALAVQIVCPLDNAGHAFLGHFIPVMTIIAIGIAVRRSLAPRSSKA